MFAVRQFGKFGPKYDPVRSQFGRRLKALRIYSAVEVESSALGQKTSVGVRYPAGFRRQCG